MFSIGIPSRYTTMKRYGSSKSLTVVGMLVAGGLAFGGHRYWLSNPEFANSVKESLGFEVEELETDEDVEETPLTTADLIAEMEDAEATLSRCSESSHSQVVQDAASILTHNLTKILKSSEDDSSQSDKDEALRIAHRGIYLATEVDNNKYGPTFVKINKRLSKSPPTEDDGALARMLGYLQSRTFVAPLTEEGNAERQAIADSLGSEHHEVTFACLLAHKLKSAGKSNNAKALLESTIPEVEDNNERARLVQTIIELNLRVGPPPSVTQEQYDALVKTVQGIEARACRAKFG